MLVKLIDEYTIRACPASGVSPDGRAVSGLPAYLADDPSVAAQMGYYPYIPTDPPEVGEYQRADASYAMADNTILQSWVIVDLPQPEKDESADMQEALGLLGVEPVEVTE